MYSEQDWNPLTMEDALKDMRSSYRVSKLFAEKAAWEFMEKEKPAFSLTTICPTFVFGPVTQPISGLDQLNTSSKRIYDFIAGNCRDKIPDTGISFFLWIDVRDLALAHIRAIEMGAAANRRYLLTAGHFNNREIWEIIMRRFPKYAPVLPLDDGAGGYPSKGVYKFNSSASHDLGLEYRTLEESVVDAVLSLQSL
jgi:nucleoside-diphosphate-sugar epimerase